ncbi:TRAP transporter substrate-binding protein [Pseudomonas berkeleyensis]|uniref:TRAP transporter substrate-binding protein n=1 Tax=Pseudomonas berkeleyensis TaxID=2726956 RepID=A0A7G5DIM5_9PSED|nr:TRAP transporter substrate-binding protein [Pseudomonas berkeleyensis]QMV61600.1 TRAP transporter substrate-binding protein [Pseudomonas berkeleyensis]WSO37030.1 TRAP transporter substrate-binding protein [Pseudomonas berkeleyensis]
MKTVHCVSALCALLVALPVAFPVQSNERWSMSVEQPAGNFISRVAVDFARNVRQATQGHLDIRVHPNSALYRRLDVKPAVSRGDIQLGDLFMSALGNEDPIYELDSLPFLATDYEQARKLWAVSRSAIEQRLLADGVRLVYAVPWPAQSLFSDRPLQHVGDLRDLRFRSYNPTISRLAHLLHAQPTTINTEDVAQAFRDGKVDVMLTSSATGMDLRAWDFVSHFYDVRAFIPKNIVIVNERAFQRLPEAHRQALLHAGERAERAGWELSWALTGYQTRMLARRGITVVQDIPPALHQGLTEVGQTLTNEWLARAGEDRARIIDDYLEGGEH